MFPSLEHATITANKTEATAGETITLTVSPDAHYVLKTITVLQGETEIPTAAVAGTTNKYTFTMSAGEVTVSAEFEERTSSSSSAFTVDANGKQVAFSQGNLQCSGVTSGNYVWSFAENQYDILGTANVSGGTASYDNDEGYSKSGSALADKIDLFGWSGDEGSAKWGVSDSETKADYYGEFADLGQNIGNGTTYYTLTYEEWDYLFNVRTNASEKIGVAQIQISDTQYANGIILLPDSWKRPTGVTFKSGFAEDGESLMQMYAAHQTFTLAEWQQLEAAGAVFLPAAGFRFMSGVHYVQEDGYYWSATAIDSKDAHDLYIFSLGADVDEEGSTRHDGGDQSASCRLMRKINIPLRSTPRTVR